MKIRTSKLFGCWISILFLYASVVSGNEFDRYIDRDLDISFVYPSDWIVGEPAEEATQVVVKWQTEKSKSVLAVCYIRAFDRTAILDVIDLAENLPQYYTDVLNGLIEKTRKRADKLEVISEKLSKIDGRDVIFTVFRATIKNLETETIMRVFTVLTFWKGHEIALECGTEYFDLNLRKDVNLQEWDGENLKELKELQGVIEKKIMGVLSSLHFDRSG